MFRAHSKKLLKKLRVLNGQKCKVSDKINTKTMLEAKKLLSINQTNAQIKLIELWKANDVTDYPIKIT